MSPYFRTMRDQFRNEVLSSTMASPDFWNITSGEISVTNHEEWACDYCRGTNISMVPKEVSQAAVIFVKCAGCGAPKQLSIWKG